MPSRALSSLILSLIFFILSTSSVSAATFFVAPNGNNGNTGTQSNPWKTIQYAVTNPVIQPGDTINVLPGTYNENIQILDTNGGRQGSAGNPITLTSLDPNNMAVITGLNARNQMQIFNRSYWTIDHLAFKNYKTGGIHVLAKTANVVGITIQNNLFENQDAQFGVMWHPIALDGDEPYAVSYSYINKNVFRNIKTGPSTGYNETITAHHNVHHVLVEGNEIWGTTYIGLNAIANDYVYGTGKPSHIIIRNNRVDNVAPATPGSGARTGLYVDGADYVLYENNYITRANGMSISAENWTAKGKFWEFKHNIVRNNILDGTGGNSSIMLVVGADHYTVFPGSDGQRWVDDSAVVNNVLLINNAGGGAFKWGFNRRARVKNNVMANYASGGLITYIMANLTVNGWVSDGNLYWRPGGPAFSWPGAGNPNTLSGLQSASGQDYNSIYGEPVFAQSNRSTIEHYKLTASSPGYSKGVNLTTATNSGTSSKNLVVADAGYFIDGWGLIKGDLIAVGNQSNRSRITSVNYSTNTITLETPLTWTSGSSVNYAQETSNPTIGYISSLAGDTDPIVPTPTPQNSTPTPTTPQSTPSHTPGPTRTPTPVPCPSFSSGNATCDSAGTIDLTDFTCWKEELLTGTAPGGCPGGADFDTSGSVDILDFTIWQVSYARG